MPENVSQIVHLLSPLVRRETYDNRPHLVVPSVVLLEGVWNGAMYEAEELAKHPNGWNGRPILVDHPELHGQPVSAADPKILERQSVGVIFGAKYDEWYEKGVQRKGLKVEQWIDVEKCRKLDPALLSRLENGTPTEVSTGHYRDIVPMVGQYGGKPFSKVHRNLVPDHLALLPNSTGACSWEDGAGAPRTHAAVKDDALADRLEKLVVVLEKKFTGDTNMERKDRIDALLKAEKPAFIEADRDFLTKLSDEQFDKIETLAKPAEKKEEKKDEKKADKKEPADKKVVTLEEFLPTLPVEVREELEDLRADREARREKAIGTLKANPRNPFSDEEFATAPLKQLEGMVALMGQPADYSGQGGTGAAGRRITVLGLEMPKVEFTTEAKK